MGTAGFDLPLLGDATCFGNCLDTLGVLALEDIGLLAEGVATDSFFTVDSAGAGKSKTSKGEMKVNFEAVGAVSLLALPST